MKQVFAISTLILFAYIQLFNGLVFMSYEINKSEIIQKFCENKDKPELKCEGTCHMKKMMLTDEAEEENEPMTILPEIELFANDFGFALINNEVDRDWIDPYHNLYSFKFLDDRVIPPKS